MKNKHLVLLFLAVIVIGLLARLVPLRYHSFFQTELIRVDTAAMTRCIIQTPGQPDLALERTETGWTADQDKRTSPVAAAEMTALLTVLAAIPSLRTIKTKQPDTLGFGETDRLAIRVFQDKRLIEYFELGTETLENGQPATYLQLPLHTGMYLAPGHLRQLFSRRLDDFRSKTVVSLNPDQVRRIGLQFPPQEEPVFFEKNDTTGRWKSGDGAHSLTRDSVHAWLALFSRLNDSPFADNFDESQAPETRIATFQLETADSTALTIQFYFLQPPNVPEDLSDLRRQQVHRLPVYVLHSSENPLNYFAPPDTNLVRFLCFGLWRNDSLIPAGKPVKPPQEGLRFH